MDSQKAVENKQSLQAADAAVASCRKKKSEQSSFLEDVRDHIDEFVNASFDEHKTCFTKTIRKMFDMSKVVAERNSGTNEVESSLSLQTTTSQ